MHTLTRSPYELISKTRALILNLSMTLIGMSTSHQKELSYSNYAAWPFVFFLVIESEIGSFIVGNRFLSSVKQAQRSYGARPTKKQPPW